MSEETLLSASRRVVRFFNIDCNHHGGLISVQTQHAIETLDAQVRKQDEREKKLRLVEIEEGSRQ